MRKLALVICCTSALIAACADEPDNSNPQSCPACDETTCPKQEECPSLECDGNKCPECPACDQTSCPPAKCEMPDCPTCETCETCDKSAIESENTKLKDDLQAQVEATEACTGDLDTCSKDLATNKLRNSKSGSRLKVYNYVSEDGAQWPSLSVFDSKKNVKCTIRDFSEWSEFGCTDQTYCVTTNKYETDRSYLDKNLIKPAYQEGNYSYLCDKLYNNSLYNGTMTSMFYSIDIGYSTTIREPRADLFIDSSCSVPFTDNYITDDACLYNSSSMFYESKYNTEQKQNVCMDNTIYPYTSKTGDPYYVLYQPKVESFTTIYYINSSGKCVDYGDKNVILLKKIKEITNEEVVNMARANREKYCKQICGAINKEAMDEDWAKIQKVVAE